MSRSPSPIIILEWKSIFPLDNPETMPVPRNSSTKTANGKSRARALEKKRASWKGLTLDDLKNIGQKIKERFKWNHSPRQFQLEAVEAQLQRKDVLIHAGTGSGKTFVAAGPHAHEKTEGMVTFMVSPLIVLQEEQVREYVSIMRLSILKTEFRRRHFRKNTTLLRKQ